MLFISKFRKHRIVLKPDTVMASSIGDRFVRPGIKVQFEEYKYETTDENIIKLLRAHRDFGIDFRSQDEFVPNEAGVQNQEVEKKLQDTLVTSCPKCPFKAKTESGLRLHMMNKHGGNKNDEPEDGDEVFE